MRVVIFGGTGLLGSSIQRSLKKKVTSVIFQVKKKSDFKSKLQSDKNLSFKKNKTICCY